METNLAAVLPDVDEPTGALSEQTRQLQAMEHASAALIPADDETEEAATLFVSKCRQAEKELDAERKTQTDPLHARIKAISEPYKKVIEAFMALRMNVQWRLDDYRKRKALAQAAEQQRLIEAANRKQAEEQAKAEAARKAADQARAAGDEQAAAKLESKAERSELRASTVEIPVLETVKKTVRLEDGSSVTFSNAKDWGINGYDKKEKIYADDPRFNGLDWNKYKRFFVLDVVRVNAAFKGGEKLPHPPFFEISKGGTTVRGGK